MKLLLTSSGLSKRKIGQALQSLAAKPASECKIGFIPTAANVEPYNKDWLIGQFLQLQRYGFYQIDIVDISADGVDWRSRLADADILWVSGGNTFHLLDQMRKTGFDDWLVDNLKDKIYVGGSASSIVVTPTIRIAEPIDQNLVGLKDMTGLGLVDFEINVHCNEASILATEQYARTRQNGVYALDDLSAVMVTDDQATVISDGSWRYFKPV